MNLRISTEEKQQIKQLAERHGMSVNEYVLKSAYEDDQLKAIQELMAGDPVLSALNLILFVNLELINRNKYILPNKIEVSLMSAMEDLKEHIETEFAKKCDTLTNANQK